MTTTALYTCLQREARLHPQMSEQERIRNVATFVLPANVAGSPSYHRKARNDLICISHHHGLPHLFLTLTADEHTELRWPEVRTFEDLMRLMLSDDGRDLNWSQAPVEMARLFVDRVNAFLREHVLCATGGLYGKINHFVLRYEAQVSACFSGIAAGGAQPAGAFGCCAALSFGVSSVAGPAVLALLAMPCAPASCPSLCAPRFPPLASHPSPHGARSSAT